MSEANQKQASHRRRYPSLNLEQALERARVLYEMERLNPAPLDVVTKHWGFKNSKTGPASTTYSAVKQFGLIDETGNAGQRKAAVSQRARAILTAPDDVREREIREAALAPPMNRSIWERYGADTGSPDAFRWHLISEMGFSDTGANEFAKQYVATIRFAGLDLLAPDGGGEPEEADEPSTPVPAMPSIFDGMFTTPQPSRPQTPEPPTTTTAPMGRTSRHAIPLIGGKQVILEGEFPLTEAAWQGFMAVLAAFKPGLVSDDQPSTSAPPENTPQPV